MVKIIVLTGYLGSGKTTTLAHILKTKPKDTRVSLIINERARIGVDATIIPEAEELTDGCVCCDKREDLKKQVEEAKKNNPDYIIIETTGVADLQPILELIPETTVAATVLDVQQYAKTKKLGVQAKNHITSSNVLIMNKIDTVDAQLINELRTQLAQINPNAVIHATVQGNITLKQIIQATAPPPKIQAQKPVTHGSTALTITLHEPTTKQQVQEFIQTVPQTITRIKGIIRTQQATYILQHTHKNTEFIKTKTNKQPHISMIGDIHPLQAMSLVYASRKLVKKTISHIKNNILEPFRATK